MLDPAKRPISVDDVGERGGPARSVRSETLLVSSPLSHSARPRRVSFWSRALRKWIISDVISHALCSLSFHSFSVRLLSLLVSLFFSLAIFKFPLLSVPSFHSSRLSLVSSSFPPPLSPRSSLSLCFSRSFSHFTFWNLLPEFLCATLLFCCIYFSSISISLSSSGSFHMSSWRLSVFSSFSLLTTTSSSFFCLCFYYYYFFPPQKTFHWPLWISQRFIRFIALVRASGVCVCVFLFKLLYE